MDEKQHKFLLEMFSNLKSSLEKIETTMERLKTQLHLLDNVAQIAIEEKKKLEETQSEDKTDVPLEVKPDTFENKAVVPLEVQPVTSEVIYQNYWKTIKAYPSPILSKYFIGKTGQCVVRNFEAALFDGLMYINDIDCSVQTLNFLFKHLKLEPISRDVLKSGDLVWIDSPKAKGRGIFELHADIVEIFMIDHGTYLLGIPEKCSFFKIQERFTKLPALALLVKVEEGPKNIRFGPKYVYKVLDLVNDILHIKLWEIPQVAENQANMVSTFKSSRATVPILFPNQSEFNGFQNSHFYTKRPLLPSQQFVNHRSQTYQFGYQQVKTSWNQNRTWF